MSPLSLTLLLMAAKVEDLAIKWVGEYEKRQGRLDNELSKAIYSLKSTVMEVAASFPKAPKPLGYTDPQAATGALPAAAEKDKALERLEDLKAIAELGVQVAQKAGVSHAQYANSEVLKAATVAMNGYGSGPIASSVAAPNALGPGAPGSATSPLDAAREASRFLAACFYKIINAQAAFSVQLSNAAAAETRVADQAAQLTKSAAEAMSKQSEDAQKAAGSDVPAPAAASGADNSAALLKEILAEAERESNLAKKNLEEAEAAVKANEDNLDRLESCISKLRSEVRH